MLRIIFVVALSVLGVLLLLWTKPETRADLKPLPLARVVVATVQQQDMTPITRLTGRLQPVRRAELRFELSGQIQDRHIEPGQTVNEGEVLLTIDAGDYEDRLAEAKADLKLEQANLQRDRQQLKLLGQEKLIQQREVKRLKDLGQKSLASKSTYDAAQAALLKLRSEEARLQNSVNSSASRLGLKNAKVNMAERNLNRTKLTAPFAAMVNRVEYELGDYARSGEVAVELVQLDQMDLYLEVTGRVMSQLSVGQTVDIEVKNRVIKAQIISLEPDPNTETMTHGMKIRMSGEGLYSGQLADAVLPGDVLSNVAVIPASAIVHEEGQAFVYRVNDQQLLERVEVTLLARQSGEIAVQGIDANQQVVARDVASLSDGQEVAVENR